MGELKKEYRCVLDLAHDIIGGKWKLRILWNIQQGNNRFSMLERAIPEITQKNIMLTSPYAGCTANAPMAFVACYRKECRMPEYAPIDLSASVENLLLEADELGLGAVWLGIAPLRDRMDKVREVISIPEELEAFAIIPCGYPVQIKNQQNHYEKERVHFVE